MRPYPEEILRAIQTGVMTHLAPEVQSAYGKAQFAFSMLLFGIAQRDYDSAVPDLIDANKALRGLFGEAAVAFASVDRAEARAALEAIAAIPPPSESLRLSALRAEHEALRTTISRLAPLIEPAADDDAMAALRPARLALYDWLRADAKRREVPILSA